MLAALAHLFVLGMFALAHLFVNIFVAATSGWDWGRFTETLVGVTGPVLAYLWKNRRQAIKENQKKHDANQKKLEDIETKLNYHSPHSHTEVRPGINPSTPLTVGGITFPPPDSPQK